MQKEIIDDLDESPENIKDQAKNAPKPEAKNDPSFTPVEAFIVREEFEKEVRGLKQSYRFLYGLMVAIIIVMLATILSLLFAYLSIVNDTRNNFNNTVNEFNNYLRSDFENRLNKLESFSASPAPSQVPSQ